MLRKKTQKKVKAARVSEKLTGCAVTLYDDSFELNVKFNSDEFIKEAMDKAQKDLSTDGELWSGVFLFGEKKAIGHAIPLYGNQVEKQQAYEMVGYIAGQTGAGSIFVINDAWISTAPKEGAEFVRPSHDPNRKEAITGQLILADGSVAYQKIIPYTRDGNRIMFGKSKYDSGKFIGKQFLVPRWVGKAEAAETESAVA